ncbi:MAG: SUMF1/EgtB/PvdO family nonheme iron enzyme, partial [Planctomycetota bacterium]
KSPLVLKELEALSEDFEGEFEDIELVNDELLDSDWEFDGQRWSYVGSTDFDRPMHGVSHLSALEYCHWRTETAKAQGKSWSFRLPTDREWERAARGVDRRLFSWGNYLVWSYCRSERSDVISPPSPVGSAVFDVSPFGVYDMTGSCSEHTTGRPVEDPDGSHYRSVRGGSWGNFDDVYFRLSSRNTLHPESSKYGSGLRLVLELPKNEG